MSFSSQTQTKIRLNSGRPWDYLSELPDIKLKKHKVIGQQQVLTEIYLIGNTSRLTASQLKPCLRSNG